MFLDVEFAEKISKDRYTNEIAEYVTYLLAGNFIARLDFLSWEEFIWSILLAAQRVLEARRWGSNGSWVKNTETYWDGLLKFSCLKYLGFERQGEFSQIKERITSHITLNYYKYELYHAFVPHIRSLKFK